MKITFLPQALTGEAEEGETILQAAIKAGASIDGNCAGMGTCGKCKVKVLSGNKEVCRDPHRKLSEQEIEQGVRLACCQPVSDGMVVEIPDSETTAARKKRLICLPEGFVRNAAVKKIFLSVPKASLLDQRSDEVRIREVLDKEELTFNGSVLRHMPKVLKESRDVTLTIRNNRVLYIEAGDKAKENYGIAVDIGTTTVVVLLWNLETGELVQAESGTNPQGAYGADVISRITYAMEQVENLETLHQAILQYINKAVEKFQKEAEIDPEHIYQYVVVGNTTMSHLFLGVDPSQLAASPFAPVFTGSVQIKAEELGLKANKNAVVYLAANIAGHVGSDITAGIITTDLMDCNKGHLFIDIGTNGEIVLTGKGRAVACSTAAGPAFEGSSVKQGMRAAGGAIERVELSEEEVQIAVIGGGKPIGICGSGIIDALGEILRFGIVDRSGRLLSGEKLAKKGVCKKLAERVRPSEKGSEFVLYFSPDGKSDVVLSQKDVREVQLAKAAISAGISILMKEAGISADDLERISIAGAFGSYIRNTSAIHVGLLPPIEEDKIVSLGNSAGIGASMMLLSAACLAASERAAGNIEHIELAAREDFQEEYMAAMMF